MVINFKTYKIVLGMMSIGLSFLPIISYIKHINVATNTHLFLTILSSIIFMVLGILIIKQRNVPFTYSRKKLIFFIGFILIAVSWLFYIRYQQNNKVKELYKIERERSLN